MKTKYIIMVGLAAAALIAGVLVESGLLTVIGVTIALWAILGDIADGLEIHKVTKINGNDVFVHVAKDDEEEA